MNIYCDGACIPNPGPMGIGVYIPARKFKLSEFIGHGTNQIAELKAIREALLQSRHGDVIFSDSMYAINTTVGLWKPKVNVEEVERNRVLFSCRRVVLRWTKGHAGNKPQEQADKLANEAARKGANVSKV